MTFAAHILDLYAGPFWAGTIVTLQLTITAIALGSVLGGVLAMARLYGTWPLRAIEVAYVEFWRGTPLLVQLFLVYFGMPALGITLDRMFAAILTLGLNSAAYQAEYFRGAMQSVDPGQMVAARAIGMSRFSAVWNILVPQAARLVIPSWSNEVVGTLKASAVVFVIAVPDLMARAKIIFGRTFNPVEAYSVVAIVYLVLVAAFMLVLHWFERRYRLPEATVGR